MSKKFLGKRMRIIGEVVEHLQLGKKEWVTIQFPDGKKITVNKKYCESIEEDYAHIQDVKYDHTLNGFICSCGHFYQKHFDEFCNYKGCLYCSCSTFTKK